MARKKAEIYPDFSIYVDEIAKSGISAKLIGEIIKKHEPNSKYNRELYERYMVLEEGVPIFKRREKHENSMIEINNKINHDFFGEIIDFKTGYFAGIPIAYGYSVGKEAQETTGGEEGIDKATKAITDFTTRNNMFGVDMEVTRNAAIYGYSGRLFYIDKEGTARVIAIHGYESIFLSKTTISEPEYAIRYFTSTDLSNNIVYIAEYYDSKRIVTYKGASWTSLKEDETKEHIFGMCPFHGIANNPEMIGDAEKVLSEIDDYDKTVSDNSNELESFVHAYLCVCGYDLNDEQAKKARKSGIFIMPSMGATQGEIKFLTKDINDAFSEHHLTRLQQSIYRHSKTPNLSDESFGTSSGEALKFKLHGLETKCGIFQAQFTNSAQYMWQLLAKFWGVKGITVDPLQITMDFTRNFPLNMLSEAQAAQALTAIGLPKRIVWSRLPFIEDVDMAIELAEQEKNNSEIFYDDVEDPQDDEQEEALKDQE